MRLVSHKSVTFNVDISPVSISFNNTVPLSHISKSMLLYTLPLPCTSQPHIHMLRQFSTEYSKATTPAATISLGIPTAPPVSVKHQHVSGGISC